MTSDCLDSGLRCGGNGKTDDATKAAGADCVGQAFDEDARIDVSVRPKRLDEYIGQKRVKENIQIAIEAARSRDEALDHVLLTARRVLERPHWRKSSPTN